MIAIKVKNKSSDYSYEVYYGLSICRNLLSIGQLVEKDYDLYFNKYGCIVSDVENGVILKTNMQDRLHHTLSMVILFTVTPWLLIIYDCGICILGP